METIREIVRDAPFGQLVRYATRNRFFKYPEELPGFEIPSAYTEKETSATASQDQVHSNHSATTNRQPGPAPATTTPLQADLEKLPSRTAEVENASDRNSTSTTPLPLHALPFSPSRLEAELALHTTHSPNHAIAPVKTADGLILAEWYTTTDPANPQNWPQGKKTWTAFLICLYTFIVYAGSSIYVSSTLLVMSRFGVGAFRASLGLALYVLGYGIGPLLFAPLSEVPQLGRNIPYITTFALFTILTLPTALVDNLGGLLFLRFLLGFFGSPCLANGGATMQDLYSLLHIPYGLAFWTAAAFAGPALGPLLSGFSVYAENWRWSQWELLWMAAPVFLLFFFFLPETQPTTILLHRSARLRALTGNANIRTQTEIDRKGTKFSATLLDAVIKPLEICVKDPALFFINVYSALTYGIYYSFFEVFPLVYLEIYGFSVGEMTIVFLSIIVGCVAAMTIYFSYLRFYLIPDILKRGLRPQEHRLVPAIFASFGVPIGLFIFGWTARQSVHWIASAIGIVIYSTSVYIIFQAVFSYVPMSYPQYAASLFAGNDFCRSAFAFGSVLFSRPMYLKLGIGKGISLLGGLSVMGIIGMYLIWVYGARLRARSKFAV
ncbi:multidrug transporter [Alternaria rosae]|uniref:multidrug transporter n=1 Tax=Alternaria rosae TaxID=1187941 RepID=UPI001E8DF75A|nr:multidrug transporter [Alternaria rosae]KAH6866593.1 multidrug transporter [Alternaria rosae]